MPGLIKPAVWFPAIRANTGVDIFTRQLASKLEQHGLRSEIYWLPHRSEYAPWSVLRRKAPEWANIVHMNTWLHRKFATERQRIVATMHLCVHDPALEPYKGRLQSIYHRFWIKPIEGNLLAFSDRVVSVSDYTAKQTEKSFGIQTVETIHNGVDTALFKPLDRRYPNRPFRLLYVGNWIARKGVDLLPHIMESLGDQYELAFTSSKDWKKIREKLPTNMKPLGRINSVEEMVKIYQQADALLFPTRLEGLSLCALEAQACGLPVIATRGSSLPETVNDGKSGILCEQDNVGAFADAARKMASDRTLWLKMRAQARNDMENYFSIDRMVTQYIAIYTELLNDIADG